MLRDVAVVKEKRLKFYYRWTGPYLVRSVTKGGMSYILQHPPKTRPYTEHTIGMTFACGRFARNTCSTLLGHQFNPNSL